MFAEFAGAVADDFAVDHVEDVFGDVGGVVGDAFQGVSDSDEGKEALERFRSLAGFVFQGGQDLAGLVIDFVVA